jgi:hypothetical protein
MNRLELLEQRTEEERQLVRLRAQELLQKARELNTLLAKILDDSRSPP